MKLTIDRQCPDAGAVPRSGRGRTGEQRPDSSNILMEAEGDRLRLTATDLDIEATDAAEATVKKAGSVTAPG